MAKDARDKKTADLFRTPNARRQAAFAERQRAKGFRKYSYWMKPEEAEKVAELIKQLRNETGVSDG